MQALCLRENILDVSILCDEVAMNNLNHLLRVFNVIINYTQV